MKPLHPRLARALHLFGFIMKHSTHAWQGSMYNDEISGQQVILYNMDDDTRLTVHCDENGNINIWHRH
jgi:hypothetical protein